MVLEFIATKVVSKVFDKTLKKVTEFAFPKETYKTRLIQVIEQTINQYESGNPPPKNTDKFPFYKSEAIFEKLTSMTLLNEGSYNETQYLLQESSNVITPSKNELQAFYSLFINNIRNDQKLITLFVNENYQYQIFKNTELLKNIFVNSEEIRHDIKEIKELLGKENGNRPVKIPKELTTILPRLSKEKIVGRTNDLEDLKKRLFNNKQVVLMNGMGGIGKTTLAMVYLNENFDNYKHIAWIKSSGEDFENDLVSTPGLLESLQIRFDETTRKTFDSVIIKLKSLEEKCLLIIDDAKQSLSNYFSSLPNYPNWHVIVTSREKIPHFELKELGFLDEKEAIDLFKLHYRHKRVSDDEIKVLVNNVEYHTLTVEILAKTAQDIRTPPEELHKAIMKDLQTDVRVLHSDEKINKVFSYISSIFDLSELSNDEIEILRYFSLLPSEYITFDMLNEVFSFVDDIPVLSLNGLSKKGWILYNEKEDSYKLHQIILEIIKSRYDYNDEFVNPLVDNISNLLSIDQSKDNPIEKFKWITFGRELIVQGLERKYSISSKLQNNLALVLMTLGDYVGAQELLEKAIILDERNFGKEHSITATRYSNLALVFQDLGDYSKAKELLEKVVKSDEQNFGEDHPLTAIGYSNLALVLKDLGDYGNAKVLLEKAVNSDERNFGENHPATARSYSNLALVLEALGDYVKAKELLEKAVYSAERSFGKEHPTTALAYSNLGMVLKVLGDYEGAKELLKKTVDLDERNYGEQHPATARSYSNLAVVLEALGDYEGAKILLEKAVLSCERNFGEEHPKTGLRYSNLAMIYKTLGNYSMARALMEKAVYSSERNFGEEHPTTARRYSNLATVYRGLGDYRRAKMLLEKAVYSDERNFGEEHPTTAVRYSNLAMVLQDLGDNERAKVLLEKAVLSDEKNLGIEHPSTAIRYSNLAMVLQDLGDYERAKELLEKALNTYTTRYGKNHPNSTIIKDNLKVLLKKMK